MYLMFKFLLIFIFVIGVSLFLINYHCLFLIITIILFYILYFYKFPLISLFRIRDVVKYSRYRPFLFSCLTLSISLMFMEIFNFIVFAEEVNSINIEFQLHELKCLTTKLNIIQGHLNSINMQSNRN